MTHETNPSPSDEPRAQNAGLDQFGGGIDPDPPRIKPTTRIHLTRADGLAGRVGPLATRDGLGFVTRRDSHTHRLRKLAADNGGAYAISTDVLRTLTEGTVLDTDTSVTHIFVHETDTGDVYEWPFRAFYPDGAAVPGGFLDTTGDPQNYASRETATRWANHAPAPFYIPKGTDTDQLDDPPTDQ